MAKRRYHYDAKGRLKGYSTDKYQPKLRHVFLWAAAFAIGSLIWKSGSGKESERSANGVNSSELGETSPPQLNSPSTVGLNDFQNTKPLEDEGYFVAQPRQSQPSGYERDLKPYYQEQCAAGDQSACQSLEVDSQ